MLMVERAPDYIYGVALRMLSQAGVNMPVLRKSFSPVPIFSSGDDFPVIDRLRRTGWRVFFRNATLGMFVDVVDNQDGTTNGQAIRLAVGDLKPIYLGINKIQTISDDMNAARLRIFEFPQGGINTLWAHDSCCDVFFEYCSGRIFYGDELGIMLDQLKRHLKPPPINPGPRF